MSAGNSPSSASSADRIALRETPISVEEVVAQVTRPGAGGIATFIGVVRDESEGRSVTRLDYSAYTAMAKREMQKVVEEIEREIEGVRVSAIHRLGSLGVGEAAIVCAASAPHRAEAFAACRELIDRIKARVPIWKREWGPEGAAWVGWVDARCSPDGHEHAPAAGHAHGHPHGDEHRAPRGTEPHAPHGTERPAPHDDRDLATDTDRTAGRASEPKPRTRS